MRHKIKPNANGRVYEEDSLIKAINEYKNNISEGNAYGELGHPESSVRSLDNISHIITKVGYKHDRLPRKKKKHMKKLGLYDAWKTKNKTLMIEGKLLKSPMGKIAKKLGNLNVGMRAIGEVDENGQITHTKILSFDLIN